MGPKHDVLDESSMGGQMEQGVPQEKPLEAFLFSC